MSWQPLVAHASWRPVYCSPQTETGFQCWCQIEIHAKWSLWWTQSSLQLWKENKMQMNSVSRKSCLRILRLGSQPSGGVCLKGELLSSVSVHQISENRDRQSRIHTWLWAKAKGSELARDSTWKPRASVALEKKTLVLFAVSFRTVLLCVSEHVWNYGAYFLVLTHRTFLV